ncbi:MAG: 3-isopropylmalate dehydrogenase [Patescibacteria group bacterium]|nr:3-isopropylmalate dehydrogenase [Patescibacteria group bacterium]
MTKTIAILPGDGIGLEVTEEAVKVLKKIGEIFSYQFIFKEGLIGAKAIEKTGSPFPAQTRQLCFESDAILFGAVGDPRYDRDPKARVRPEQGLLEMRKSLGLYANIRPVFVFPSLFHCSPLKPEILQGVDFIFVRELTSGIYFGKPQRRLEEGESAVDTCFYSKKEILRVAKVAFDLARKRKKKVTLVDKANVLATSQLWREVVSDFAKNSPDITLEMLYVDTAAMEIIRKPAEFDVILTENLFGDILTDEAAVISGSIGLLPSASIGEKYALYEPIHGSYPQAAGKNIANPVGSILSAAMLLEYSFGLQKEAEIIKKAVRETLEQGFGTQDIVKKNPLTTKEFGDKIIDAIIKGFSRQ